MAKKIYDILPPKTVNKMEEKLKEFMGESKGRKTTRKRKTSKPEPRFSMKYLGVGAAVLVLALVVFAVFKLGKANVEVWPKTEVLDFKQQLSIDKTASAIDLEEGVIPAQYLEEEKSASQEFPATGNASNEGKASGTITVYNKISPAESFTMKAGTHFLSDSGKYFVTLQKVTVPAAKGTGSKLTAGSVEVKVEATEGGESYNIKPAKFVVPKLAGTNYYYNIYAESKDAMAGGFEGKVKKVTDDDLQIAKDALVKKAADDATNALKQKVTSDYVLADTALRTETVNASSQTKSGAVAEKFTYSADVKAKALVFKKADLDKFARDYIVSQLSDDERMLENTLSVSYAVKTVNIESGKAVLDIQFTSKKYPSIDVFSIGDIARGKTDSQIKDSVSSSMGERVVKTEVNFWPFWVKKAPKSPKSITVDLKFE